MVAYVIGGDDGACSEGMLYFKIPLNIFRILEVAADVIQVGNRKGALRVQAPSKLLSRARYPPPLEPPVVKLPPLL